MKKLLLIWILTAMGLVISCTGNEKEASDVFNKVEGYMETHPDSALLLLTEFSHPEELSKRLRADYALLLTQARDRNYLDTLQSDSLIKVAADYYRGSEDKVKAGKALFYYGKVMALQDSATVAMRAYLEAQTALEDTKEYKLQALVEEYIGYLNYDRDMRDGAIDHYRKSIYYSGKAEDTLKMVYGYRNIARVYMVTHNYDSAHWYANSGITMLKNNKEEPVFPSLLHILGIVERDSGNYVQAINYFLDAIKFEQNSYIRDHYYLSLGSIYMQKEQYEKARSYFEISINSQRIFTQAGAYDNLFTLEKTRGNYLKAICYKEKSDSLLKISQNEDVRKQILTLQRKFESDKLRLNNKQIEQEKQTQLYFFLFIIFLIATLSGIFFLFMKRVYKERFKKNLTIIEGNMERMNQYIFELDVLKQKENLLLETTKEKIGKLNQRILLLTNENKAIRENICANAVFLLDQLKKCTLIVKRMTKEEKSQVFEYADLLFGRFITRLRSEYELTDNNVMLAVLLKIGFTSKELMLVFDCEMNSVFRMKQRLRERLHLNPEIKLEEFIALY